MPPCQTVLLNKIKRTNNVTRMIKSAGKIFIEIPKAIDGFCLNDNNEFAIEYFSGYPYPENIESIMNQNHCDNNNSNRNSNCDDDLDFGLSSSDEDSNEDIDEDWFPNIQN